MIIVRNHSETSQPLSVSEARVIEVLLVFRLISAVLKKFNNFPRSQLTQTSVISLSNPPLNRGILSRTRLNSVPFRSVEHPPLLHRLRYS